MAPKVLVVEDNEINQELMLEILERFDCDVDTAKNGVEAIEKVSTSDYALIFMDMQMPVMGGLEATKKIREMKSSIPIVALTASSMQGEKEKCLEAGMDDYLAKPFAFQDLEAFIVKYLPS